MPMVDDRQARWSSGISLLFFWKRCSFAIVLLIAGLAWPDAHAWSAAAPWLVAAAVGILAWTLAIVFYGGRHWVTSDQIVQSIGVVSRHTQELDVRSLQGVAVRQSWIERWLRVGSVRLATGGRDLVLNGVKDPNDVAELIRERARVAHPADGEDGGDA